MVVGQETKTIGLTIDGQSVKTQEGATVLEAAQQAGIYIPTLCYHPSLTPSGSCRMCIVEIEGMRGFVTACTTPWPFNFIAAESRGAVRAVREVLHYGGYKILGKIVKPGTKSKPQISTRLFEKVKTLGRQF